MCTYKQNVWRTCRGRQILLAPINILHTSSAWIDLWTWFRGIALCTKQQQQQNYKKTFVKMFLGVSEIKCLEFASIHRSKSLLGWINGCRQVLSSWRCCISGPKVSKARGNRTVETKSSCRLLSCRDISVKPHWNSKGKCDNARLGTVQKHGHRALLPLILKWFHKSFSVVMRCFRLHKCTPTAQPDTTTVKLFFQELDIHPTYLNISIRRRMKTLSEHTRKNKQTPYSSV